MAITIHTLNSIRTRDKKFGLVHQKTALLRGWCNLVSRQNVIWQIGHGISIINYLAVLLKKVCNYILYTFS